MIDTLKIGTDCDKMEELINKQYHKSVFLKKNPQVMQNNSLFFHE